MLATTRALLLAAPLAVALAALAGPPADAASRTKTVINFNEIWAEDADSAKGKLRLESRIPADPVVTAAFDAATPVSITAGAFSFSGALGDDPAYVPGATSATLTKDALDGSGRMLTAKIRWTPRQLIVRVHAITGADASNVIADNYAMEDSGPCYDNRPAEITVGAVTASWDPVACAGRVYSWSWRAEEFSIVRMHGRAAY